MKIKICGLTRPEDVDAVNAAAPDYIGFVFAENSRRFVTPERAAELSSELRESVIPVGVFVNAPAAFIEELFARGTIKIAQLHGGESEDYIVALKRAGIPVIQALRAGRGDTPSVSADRHLFDGAEGGSGVAFDMSELPRTGKPAFLAGGVNAGNISAAAALKPYAVDVSSGVETGGLKDPAKILSLVNFVRGVA